jgi:hypothetical protein
MTKECPYCTPAEEFGDAPKQPLLNGKIRIGKKTEYIEPLIFLSEKGAILEAWLFEEAHSKKINFCPICGRDLNKYIKDLLEKEDN